MPVPGGIKDILTSDQATVSIPIPTPSEGQDAGKKELRFHPEYNALRAQYIKILDAFQGGDRITTQPHYLHSHEREDDTDHKFRRERAAYYNYLQSIVGFYTGALTADPAKRGDDDTDQEVRDFEMNVDNKGKDMGDFFEVDVIPLTYALSWVAIIVDMPRLDDGFEFPNRQAEIDAGHKPFARVILPTDLVDWDLDKNDKFEWALIRQNVLVHDDPLDEAEEVETFIMWTKEDWKEIDFEGNLITGPHPHPLGEVPLIHLPLKKSFLYKMNGASFGPDVADINIKHYNLKSLIDEFLYKQAFSFLSFAGRVDKDKIGASNVMTHDPEGGPPVYVSPPIDPAMAIEAEAKDAKREMFRLSLLPFENDSRESESGESKSWDWVQLTKVLPKNARVFAHGDFEIHRLAGKWVGKEETYSIKIEWPEEFEVRKLEELIKSTAGLNVINIGPTTIKEMKKRVARAAIPDADEETLEQVDKEIDEMPDFSGPAAGFGHTFDSDALFDDDPTDDAA